MVENVFGRWMDTTFGFRGRQNILSWVVAGGMAYYFFYLPEQRKQEEMKVQHDLRRKHYEEKGLWDVDKSRPVPDKQQFGLIVGTGQQAASSSSQQPPQQLHQPARSSQTPDAGGSSSG